MLHQCLLNISSCHNIGMTEKCLDYLAKTKNPKIASETPSINNDTDCINIEQVRDHALIGISDQ